MHNKLKRFTLPKDAVGREITSNVPTVSSDISIGEIQQLLPEFAQKADSIDYIYLLNKQDQLVGVISIKELTQHDPQEKVKNVMVKNLIISHPQVDRERVTHLAIKHNIKAVPIVDDQKKFLGVLSNDKLLSILYEEYKEDAYRTAGIVDLPESFSTLLNQGVWKGFVSRFPWIIIGLFGGLFTAKVIGQFEDVLTTHIILASFIPLVAYIANAVGTQTQTLYIREVAFGKVKILSYAAKQLVVTAFIGIFCWLLLLGLGTLLWQSTLLGHIVGMSVMAAISAATFFSLLIPFSLIKLNFDPAVGAGPFATIIQDLLSIYIYFLIASALL